MFVVSTEPSIESSIEPSIAVTLPSVDALAALDSSELDEVLWQLEQLRRRVEAAIVAVIDRSHRTAQFAADGHRSVRGWTQAITNCSPGEAARRDQTARALRVLPTVGDEFAGGRLGVAQVHELAKVAANPRCVDQLPGSEAVLLGAAKSLPFCDFRTVIQRWERLADADGAHREQAATHEHRTANLTEVGGEFRWDTRHGALDGTAMQQVFAKFCDAEFHTDWQATKAQWGDAASAALMPRTSAQRRADALTAVFHAAARAGVDGTPLDVVVNLLIDYDQFEQHAREAVDGTSVAIDPASVRARRCETSDGVPVDPRNAVALAFIGRVRRVVIDSAGVVANAGRLRRLYTGPIREVLMAIDPRCTWLGCMIRAAISEIDHALSFADGGTTDAANAGVVCSHHNLFKDRNGYTAARSADGTHVIMRPDGTAMRPPDAA